MDLKKIKINNKYYRTLPSVEASLIMTINEKLIIAELQY